MVARQVAEVQLQVTAMQAQAEEQGHVAARAQAAEMQAQVAQMQVHAAQMQVHAAQMQIRATEMQGQAAEMQSSALSIRAQAATVSFAELTNTATNALTQAAAASNAGAAGAATADTGAASVRVEEIRGEAELGAERVSQGGDDGASSAAASVENARGSGGSAEQESTYTDGRHVVEHAPAASGSSLPETAAGSCSHLNAHHDSRVCLASWDVLCVEAYNGIVCEFATRKAASGMRVGTFEKAEHIPVRVVRNEHEHHSNVAETDAIRRKQEWPRRVVQFQRRQDLRLYEPRLFGLLGNRRVYAMLLCQSAPYEFNRDGSFGFGQRRAGADGSGREGYAT